jgi:hypothetical protein
MFVKCELQILYTRLDVTDAQVHHRKHRRTDICRARKGARQTVKPAFLRQPVGIYSPA